MFKTNSNNKGNISSFIIAHASKMWPLLILNQNILIFFKKVFQNQFEIRGHLVSLRFKNKSKKTSYHNIYTYRNRELQRCALRSFFKDRNLNHTNWKHIVEDCFDSLLGLSLHRLSTAQERNVCENSSRRSMFTILLRSNRATESTALTQSEGTIQWFQYKRSNQHRWIKEINNIRAFVWLNDF